MKKEFVNYNQASELQKLGFNEPCFGWYENNELVTLSDCINPEDRIEFIKVGETSKRIPAPTFSQAFRWFREKYNLHYFIDVSGDIWFFDRWSFDGYKTYEEAESACLDKLIEIAKKM